GYNQTFSFNTGSGSLIIRSQNGSSLSGTMNVGYGPTTTGNWIAGSVDLSNHSVDVSLNALNIGGRTGGSGANSYGGFTFNSGTLSVNSVMLGSNNNPSTTLSTGTLTIGGGNAAIGGITMADAKSGTAVGTLVVSGGTLAMSGNISQGATTGSSIATFNLGAATLRAGSNFTVGSGIAMSLTANATLDSNANTMTIASGMSGSFGFTKIGTGTLALTAANTYTGTTTVANGTLDIGGGGSTGSISSLSPLVLSGGTLSLTRANFSQAFASTTLNAGAQAVSAVSTGTINLGAITRNTGAVLSIPGTGAFITSSGNTNGILGGWAVYSGTTWAVSGTANPITGLDSASYTTTVAAGTTASSYTNANIDVTSSAGTLGGAITPNSFRFNTAAATTVTLTGSNQMGSGGILVTSNVGNFASTITGGTITSTANEVVVAQNNPSNSLTIASVIANNGATAAAFTKIGSGTLTLSSSNAYTGNTTIGGGVVNVGNTAAFGTGTVSFSAAATLQAGTAGTVTNAIVLPGAGLTTTIDTQANNLTLPSLISGAGNLTKIGSGTLTYGSTSFNSSASGYTGATYVLNGTLVLNAFNGQPTLKTGNTVYLGDTSGSANTTLQIGNGGAKNYFDGNIVVQSNNTGTSTIYVAPYGAQNDFLKGTITLGSANQPGHDLAISVAAVVGAVAPIATVIQDASGATSYGSVSFQFPGASTSNVYLVGNSTYQGATNIAAGFPLYIGNPTAYGGPTTTSGRLGSGPISNSGQLVFARTDAYGGAYGNSISGTGSLTVNTGTLTLSGSSSYTGLTTLAGGVTQANNANALGASGTIKFTGGTLQYSSASAGQDWATRIKSSTSAISLDTNSQTITLAGAIDSTNTAGLTKLGTGTLALSGTNTYTGTTSINAGILSFGGTSGLQGTSGVTIAGGAGLTYTGGAATFGKNVT
ncbi:MAG: autotransporter-associated beta strand repeat-containing protein, partial [Planctomycetota bacterium]